MSRKKGIFWLYLSIAILGILFLIEAIKENKLAALGLIGLTRFLASNLGTIQQWLIHW